MVAADEIRTEARRPRTGAPGTRTVFLLLVCIFIGGVVLQVFLAGLGVLVEPARLADHRAAGHLVLLIPYGMLVVGLFARLRRRTLALTVILVLLAIAHDALLYVPAGNQVEFLRALHPVNALILFWIAVHLARHGLSPRPES